MTELTDISDTPEVDIEPCPFCGRTPAVKEMSHCTIVEVHCDNGDCEIHPWVLKNSRKEALDAWNTRLGQ